MSVKPALLVVEDEPKLQRLLEMSLKADGYEVWTARDGETALRTMSRKVPDLLILDVGLPGKMDGFEVLRTVRSFSAVPVIILTGRARESEKLAGFEAGADDYVTKPFSYPELGARVRAVLQRSLAPDTGGSTSLFQVGDLEIDYPARRVCVNKREIHLTPTEYKLLNHLAVHAGRVLLHEELLTTVWGPEYRDEYQYLRNYVSHLRKKVEPDPASPRYILSKPGIGYYLADR